MKTLRKEKDTKKIENTKKCRKNGVKTLEKKKSKTLKRNQNTKKCSKNIKKKKKMESNTSKEKKSKY